MRRVKIFDTTLRDGEQAPGCTMHLEEKLELAKKLEKLGVDIVEAGFPVTSAGDAEAVRAIAGALEKTEVCALARAIEGDVDAAYRAIKGAVIPRIHVFIPTSALHMESKLRMSPEEVLENIARITAYARKYLDNVQISFEDATRSDKDFLIKAVKTAQKSGAKTINVADTVGYSCPEDIAELIDAITRSTDVNEIEFGVHCHNDLGMAVANTLTAIKHGVNHVECTLNGIGERGGNASMEEVVMALNAKPEYGAATGINTREIFSASRLLSSIIGVQIPPNKPIVGSNVFLHESGIHQHGVLMNKSTYEIITPESIGVPKQEIILGKHSGKHAFKEFLNEMNVAFDDELLDKHFKDFKDLCDKKKVVTALDIEALVSRSGGTKYEERYTLKNFLIATKKDGAFATVTLLDGDKELAYQADGNGALDSSFTAVNKILGVNFRLIDYSLHAITGGEDALGEAIVKLSNEEITLTGKGLSTDIVEASILAYLDASNKLIALNRLQDAKPSENRG